MKKVLIAILAFVYLAVSSGIVMEVHYCMGKVAGVDLFGTGDDHCGKCGMKEKKGGCCKDELKIYKLSDSHKYASNDISFFGGQAILDDKPAIPVNQDHTLQIVAIDLKNHAPPDIVRPSRSILNRVFRI